MSGKNINFDDKKIKRSSFYKNKKINNIEDIDVNNILVSKKDPCGTKNFHKHFTGYNDNDNIRPLCIRFPQMTGFARKFNENSTRSFIVKDKKLLKQYSKIWETIEGLMKITFKSKPVYGEDVKYIKTKTKAYAGNITRNFYNKKMSKERAPCKCLSIIIVDSLIKTNKKYYPQTLLEECKYTQEKMKIKNYINEDLEDNESDSDTSNETESDIDNE